MRDMPDLGETVGSGLKNGLSRLDRDGLKEWLREVNEGVSVHKGAIKFLWGAVREKVGIVCAS